MNPSPFAPSSYARRLVAIGVRWLPLLLALVWLRVPPASATVDDAVLWSEHQRAFFQDGPALLLSDADRLELAALDEAGRDLFIDRFLSDPLPETAVNELREGIDRRARLVRSEVATPLDDRARLLFLHGAPAARRQIDCGTTLVPVEIWTYRGAEVELVLYRPTGRNTYRLWRPHDGKRVLYSSLMEGWFGELEHYGQERRRVDIELCSGVVTVDRVTRTEGLFDEQPDTALALAVERYVAPPDDLAAWSATAAQTPVDPPGDELEGVSVEVGFPFRTGQRIAARFVVVIEDAAGIGVEEQVNGDGEIALDVNGLLEFDGDVFEDFRVRFKQPAPESGSPVVLVWDRRLRPGRKFLARLQIRDTISGSSKELVRLVDVPREVERVVEGSGQAVPAEEVAGIPLAGADSLVLIPPVGDGLSKAWRAETLVTGERITKVVFLVDGRQQLVKTRPPYTADLRLAEVPAEQVVTVRGLDRDGETVAEDSLRLNRARGLFGVRILSPLPGQPLTGEMVAEVEVTVPDEARVKAVEFSLNDVIVATLDKPPWRVPIRIDPKGEIAFLTAVAHLDGGGRAEDVLFLNTPADLQQVDVKLVELFATVTDGSGQFVDDLEGADFQVLERGEERPLERFDLVHDLPLVVGLAVDASTSMEDFMVETRRAAVGFLDSVLRPGDRAFAVAFSDKPLLVAPPTDDSEVVERALLDVRSSGPTTLYDAVVRSLFYFRGFGGRRTLVLLSDGEDTSSRTSFTEALEYAKHSGVVIYSIGLGNGASGGKLKRLAGATGGRYFKVRSAPELALVYAEIERELRSQYFMTFVPIANGETNLDEVEVRVRGERLKVRSTRGYAP